MSAFDFSGLSNTTTWTDSNFSQDTTNFTQGQVVAQTAGGSLHALAASTGGTGIMRAKLVGKTWGTTLAAKITLNGIRGRAVTDDSAHVYLVVESGANAWKGYAWSVASSFQRLGILNSATDYDPGDSPNAWLAAVTSDTAAEGDTFELSINTATGVLIGKHNGTQITTATDTTYASGLTAGFLIISANHGGTGISRLDTTGDGAASASRALLTMLSNQGGF